MSNKDFDIVISNPPYGSLGTEITQTIIDDIRIILPALFIKPMVFAYTSFNTYFKFGILYLGNSEI